MVKPLRIEFLGVLYHLYSRGNARQAIYLDESDWRRWLVLLGEVCQRFNWVCYSYCQMTNHYPLMMETPDGNLSVGMRHLNGVYTQYFNKRHRCVGHLFQGRYASPLVEKEAYLLELCRYIVLNPVRAGMVGAAENWQWSSYRQYRQTAGLIKRVDEWLQIDWLLSRFGAKARSAIEQYKVFVAEGNGQPSPMEKLKNQIYLGPDEFVEEVQSRWLEEDRPLNEIPSAQRRPVAKPLSFYGELYPDRNTAMATAYLSGGYSMREIGEFFRVHYMTVSRAVRRFEDQSV